VRISRERQQAIGVTYATATYSEEGRALRTSGKVTYDETRTTHVHTRVEGWADKVFVNFTGDAVKKGQPMLTLYSPDMLASQQELLLAARTRDAMHANASPEAVQQAESLFQASRRRLELWDLGDDQIEQVLRTRQPIRDVVVAAPTGGVVTARNIYPNQKITPDSDLYTIVDLSRVWIVADVPEANGSLVRVGQRGSVSFASPGMAPLSATVTYIQPELDPVTRTLKVRLEVANAGQRLRPEMFVDVEFNVPAARRLTVPSDAIIDSGEHQRVFVDIGDNYLEPREVKLGERLGDRVVIQSGLAPGERVVASRTFLVDSETKLRTPGGAE
jgi:RND family efflux transporter MFP subunit